MAPYLSLVSFVQEGNKRARPSLGRKFFPDQSRDDAPCTPSSVVPIFARSAATYDLRHSATK
eukprot:8601-Prymnesium_polylepis.1